MGSEKRTGWEEGKNKKWEGRMGDLGMSIEGSRTEEGKKRKEEGR